MGEAPAAARLDQPVTDARLAAWRQHVGPSWWCHDLDRGGARLRLIGLDSALMGSAHPDEALQAAFLDEALAARDGRPVLLFLHLPPFLDDPDDPRITTHCLMPEPRHWLLDRCRSGGVAAIAAGHIHRHTVSDWQGIPIVTAPATAFVNVPADPPASMLPLRTGYLRWRFDGETLGHQVIRPRLFLSTDASN